MRLICKWKTKCADCGDTIEEDDDLWLTEEKEKLCYFCAEDAGYICVCTGDKKPEYDTCWDCKIAEQKRNGTLCACGKYKRPQYATCYSCKQH